MTETPSRELVEAAMETALAKAKADGADADDLVTHKLAYDYLRQALSSLPSSDRAGEDAAVQAVAQLEMQREGKPYSRTQEEFYEEAWETVQAVLAALNPTEGEKL